MGSKKFLLLLVVFWFQTNNYIFSAPVGSNSLVSIVSNTNFPTSDNDDLVTPNEIRGFGWMKNGFSFGDASTTCTFNSVFPVAGTVDMKGGLLYLTSDLVFANPTTLTSAGIFYANNRTIDFANNVTSIPSTNNTLFHNANVALNNDTLISGTIKFRGNCTLDGRKNNVTLGCNGAIIVDSGSSLTLKNLELDGIKNRKILCLDNTATLLLDNVRWVQSADYTFTNGSITFLNDVVCSSSCKFKYDSPCTSTIKTDSNWEFTDLGTLELGRKYGYYGREPLYFEDNSAMIKMNNSTLAITSSGVRLTRGKLVGDGAVKLDVNSTNTIGGLAMGDGISKANDLVFKLYPEAAFHLKSGHMVYDIIDGDNFLTDDVDVRFIRRGSGSVFHVNQDINLSNVTVKVDPYSDTELLAGKHIYYNNTNVSTAYGDYTITATYLNGVQELFSGNGSLFVAKGFYPFYSLVQGTSNKFSGPGDVLSPITIKNSASNLYFDLNGRVLSNIAMNGGTIILQDNLAFGNSAVLTGSGTVQASIYSIDLPLSSITMTSTIKFSATTGVLNLNSDVTLASQLTLDGHWVINGNGNFLDFGYSGSIVVNKNSYLKFKNVSLRGVKGNSIRCFDDSGKVSFDRANLAMSGNYSFTVGSFKAKSFFEIDGSYAFNYQSGMTSTVDKSSRWLLHPNTTLSIGRKERFGRQPLYFEDNTSQLIIDNATWSITGSGMQVARGTLVANREAFIDINSTATWNGLIFGDGTAANDVSMEWNAAAVVRMPKGHVTYNVTNPAAFKSRTKNTQIVVGKQFYLNLEQSVLVQNLSIESNDAWTFVMKPGISLVYQDYGVKFPGIEYVVTGYQYDAITTLLAGNQSVIVNAGAFPMVLLAMGTGNELKGFGGISGPVVLAGPTSVLTMGIASPATYGITLNGGKIILSNNLYLQNGAVFSGAGTVDAATYMVSLPAEDITLTSSVFFKGTQAFLKLNSDVKLASGLTFDGNWTILGNGKVLDFAYSGSILVNKNSQVRFKDVHLRNIGGNDIRCFDNSGKIVFDNAALIMDSNFCFTVGSFACEKLLDVSGSATFFYQSSLTSTVNAYSKFQVNPGATMSLGKKTSYGREPLYFVDRSSEWSMDNASLVVTASGMRLTRGSLSVNRDLYFDIKSSCSQFGLIIGDGTAANDPSCELYAGSVLRVPRGAFVYEGSKNNLFLSRTKNTKIQIGSSLSMFVNKDMMLKNIGIAPTVGWNIIIAAGKALTYDQYTVFLPGIEYQMTGRRYDNVTNYLPGNGEIIVNVGVLPLATLVTGAGNSIKGMGNIGAPIVMQGSTARLSLSTFGRTFTDITMSGGILTLDNLLTLGAGNTIKGAGTVNLQNRFIMMVGTDYSWTSTLTIDSNSGVFMSLGSCNIKLSGTWTFSGSATFNGQGSILDLGTTGQIIVERGSKLRLKDVTIKGIKDNRIRCLDNAGSIELQNAEWIQSGNVTFAAGALNFYDDCVITGSDTTFAYCSPRVSSIKNRSTLYLDEKVTFSYDPVTNNRKLLMLENSTAKIVMNAATLFSTPTGLQLTCGTLEINGDCPVISKARCSAEGIIFGDGVLASSDLTIDISPNSILDIKSGYLVYNNLS